MLAWLSGPQSRPVPPPWGLLLGALKRRAPLPEEAPEDHQRCCHPPRVAGKRRRDVGEVGIMANDESKDVTSSRKRVRREVGCSPGPPPIPPPPHGTHAPNPSKGAGEHGGARGECFPGALPFY